MRSRVPARTLDHRFDASLRHARPDGAHSAHQCRDGRLRSGAKRRNFFRTLHRHQAVDVAGHVFRFERRPILQNGLHPQGSPGRFLVKKVWRHLKTSRRRIRIINSAGRARALRKKILQLGPVNNVANVQTLGGLRPRQDFWPEPAFLERGMRCQEQPRLAGFPINREQRAYGVFEAREIIEIRVLAKTVRRAVRGGIGVNQQNPVMERGCSALSSVVHHRVDGCGSTWQREKKDHQN